MQQKRCFKCGAIKALTGFYVHPQMGDGRLNKCKECTKRDVQKNYRDNIEHYRQYDQQRASLPHRVQTRKEYAKTERGRQAYRRANDNWVARNLHKRRTQIKLGNAVRNGRVTKAPCVICGSTHRVAGHHDNYDRPFDVVWLCPLHHAERHKGLKS